MNITLKQALNVINAATEKATEIHTKMNICVVDTGSNLVAFSRMDDAWLGSVDISIKKAKTANWFQMDTSVLTPLVKPNEPLYNIEHSNGGLITFAGGVIIKNEANEIIGAIGVSGSSVENDNIVATFGSKNI